MLRRDEKALCVTMCAGPGCIFGTYFSTSHSTAAAPSGWVWRSYSCDRLAPPRSQGEVGAMSAKMRVGKKAVLRSQNLFAKDFSLPLMCATVLSHCIMRLQIQNTWLSVS